MLDTILSVSGWSYKSTQHSFWQPICGDPASCTVPSMIMDALLSVASCLVFFDSWFCVQASRQSIGRMKYLVILYFSNVTEVFESTSLRHPEHFGLAQYRLYLRVNQIRLSPDSYRDRIIISKGEAMSV